MKYLCLVYYDEKKIAQLSQQEWDSHNRGCVEIRPVRELMEQDNSR